MLSGLYEYGIDPKGRVSVPARLRAELGEAFMATKGFDYCVALYSMEEWKDIEQKIRALPLTKARDIQRFLFSSAMEIQPDAQGRALLPQNLRQYAGLEKEAVIVGVANRAEIWNPKAWQDRCGNIEPENIIEQMESLGF